MKSILPGVGVSGRSLGGQLVPLCCRALQRVATSLLNVVVVHSPSSLAGNRQSSGCLCHPLPLPTARPCISLIICMTRSPSRKGAIGNDNVNSSFAVANEVKKVAEESKPKKRTKKEKPQFEKKLKLNGFWENTDTTIKLGFDSHCKIKAMKKNTEMLLLFGSQDRPHRIRDKLFLFPSLLDGQPKQKRRS